MEAELNIANILKDKPSGTKLYTDAFGELKFVKVDKVDTIYTRTKEGMFYSFYNDGKYNKNGEPILVPSKEMRDWSKFAWKKGDVLVSNDRDCHITFEGFSKDDYTTFKGKHWAGVSIRRYISCLNAQDTRDYHIEDDKNATKIYINTIEERLDGKLNRKTLEIEKKPEKKIVIDLKPKWITPKPFDKVLVRDGKDEIWEPAFFFRNRPELNVYKYQTVGGKLRVYCIPFNEETAKLIGTSDDWKE